MFDRRSCYHQLKLINMNTTAIESQICRQLITKKYEYICLDVLAHRMTRVPHIHQVLLEILPRLAAFDPKDFVAKHLPIALPYLVNSLKGREKDR